MTKLAVLTLTLAAAGLLATAVQPAGSSVSGICGPQVQVLDPGLRASFARFEAGQSRSAAKICEIYRNAAEF